MMDSEQIKRFAFSVMAIHKYCCKKCKHTFIQAISTSDTDMVPIYLSSVYSTESATFVIMELTADECLLGWDDSMPKRAENVFNGNIFFYIDTEEICPVCGGELEEKQVFKLSEYIEKNPNVYIAYFGKDDEEEIVEHL